MPMSITRAQLNHRYKNYKYNKKLWDLYMAAYKGVNEIIRGGYIKQHSRELDIDYQNRMEHLYSFDYSKSVVGIYVYHLMSQPPLGRTLKAIQDDEIFNMFWNDADLEGNDFDSVMGQLSLYASIQGHMGVLIDNPAYQAKTKAEQIVKGIHPYLASYNPSAILDFKYERNPETHRPELVFLKLHEGDNKVRIFWKDAWALFEDESISDPGKASGIKSANPYPMARSIGGSSKVTGGKPAPNAIPIEMVSYVPTMTDKEKNETVTAIEEGLNPLGEIPFVWYYNGITDEKGIGESDLSSIARIDISLTTNASQIEEIINYAAFPMMLKAKRDASPKDAGSEQEDEVGVTTVIEFDPEYPESKPEWLTPEVESAIRAILDNMKNKVSEIYRAANIGGLAATEISTQAKSGTALKTEFQMLNSTLVGKATCLEKAENRMLEFFLKWEGKWEALKNEVHMGRSKDFNVEDIATDLANAITAQTAVYSDTFNILLQRQVSRQMLPSASEDDQSVIDQEIEDNVNAQAVAREKMNAMDNEDDETQDIIDDDLEDFDVQRNTQDDEGEE